MQVAVQCAATNTNLSLKFNCMKFNYHVQLRCRHQTNSVQSEVPLVRKTAQLSVSDDPGVKITRVCSMVSVIWMTTRRFFVQHHYAFAFFPAQEA
jgi:hypothetical protein